MTGNELSLIADAAVAALLVVTIGYAILLSRRLRAWREGAGDMERQVVALNDALSRATQAIEVLKAASRDETVALDAVHKKAQSLRDDLSFLVERGTSLADRMEKSLRSGLSARASEAASPAKSEPPRAPAAADRTVSSAERELLRALEAMR
ncbi:MAG: hypothetical protein IT563_22775 [Alphaproteobacteria bacterium]|nr:hypothetical protein [Alphaproteobacteria bacterium]